MREPPDYRLLAATTVATARAVQATVWLAAHLPASRPRARQRACSAAAWLADRASWLLGELLTGALAPRELADLTTRLYEASRADYTPASGLFDWEPGWYAAWLPPAPARLLLGGAGEGREAAALLDLGYAVDAFEPVPRYAAACAAVPGAGLVRPIGFAAFCDEALAGRPAGDSGGLTGPYDAVILGWCSLDHVLLATERERLLRAACAVTPRGPVLTSFHAVERAGAAWPGRPGRAGRLGRLLGRALRAARRVGGPPVAARLVWHAGFGHYTTRAEIEELAGRVGRVAVYETSGHGRAVFGAPAGDA